MSVAGHNPASGTAPLRLDISVSGPRASSDECWACFSTIWTGAAACTLSRCKECGRTYHPDCARTLVAGRGCPGYDQRTQKRCACRHFGGEIVCPPRERASAHLLGVHIARPGPLATMRDEPLGLARGTLAIGGGEVCVVEVRNNTDKAWSVSRRAPVPWLDLEVMDAADQLIGEMLTPAAASSGAKVPPGRSVRLLLRAHSTRPAIGQCVFLPEGSRGFDLVLIRPTVGPRWHLVILHALLVVQFVSAAVTLHAASVSSMLVAVAAAGVAGGVVGAVGPSWPRAMLLRGGAVLLLQLGRGAGPQLWRMLRALYWEDPRAPAQARAGKRIALATTLGVVFAFAASLAVLLMLAARNILGVVGWDGVYFLLTSGILVAYAAALFLLAAPWFAHYGMGTGTPERALTVLAALVKRVRRKAIVRGPG